MSIKKLYLELTDRCNLNCKMCYRKSWEEHFCDMSEPMLRKLADELEMHKSLKDVVIGGIGEPTVSHQFRHALELLKNYSLTVTTNGTLLNKELAEHFIKYVDVVIVSIDGLFEKFREIRGTDLNIIKNNLDTLNDLKRKYSSRTPLIGIQFVLSKDNFGEVLKVMDFASSVNADSLIVSNVIPQSDEMKESILYTRSNNESIKKLFARLTAYSMHKGMKVLLPNCELKTIRRCNFIEGSSAYVCASGDVTPCYRFSHDYIEYVFGRKKHVRKFMFGNLEKDSLINIWMSKEYSAFRNTILNNRYPSCIDCDFVNGCDLVCTSDADCHCLSPSCADCLWSREFVQCP